jgi:hypothetical protein
MLKFFLYMGAFFVLWMVFSQKFPETAHVIHGSFWDMWLALVDQGFALWAKFCAWIDASAVPK